MANITYTITQSSGDIAYTVTPDGEEITYIINDGVGPAGPSGPSNITTATETDITGILKGDGANVGAAVADTDYQSVPAEGAFADGDKTKLDGIEAGADVTDAANVNAAGAVMESDYSPAHSVLAQQSGTGSPSAVTLGTNSLLGRASGAGTSIQGLSAAQARALLNVEDGATADQTDNEILTAWENASGRSATIDGLKLDSIEPNATADQTDAEILAAVESESGRDMSVDGAKLDGIEAGATADQTAAEILTEIKTVDGTGSGLDADLLDGQDSTAFATSAQGALADSAVQPGDDLDVIGGVTITAPATAGQYLRYDGVSEFRNSAIGASDLPDLSSTYATASHTHTAGDLDFAGSTDIGADLADADEILVSDGGGNTTRRKSALSRLWTYIKSKIESVALSTLEVSGNLTVDTDTLRVDATTNEVTIAQDLYSQSTMLVVNGFSSFDGGSGVFAVNSGTWNGSTITGNQTLSGQVELTGQAASTDDSAMTKGLIRDFSSVWGNVYKSGNGETDTNSKLSTIFAGDRYLQFNCMTGTAAGDGQWTTFYPQTFGLTNGSGAKGQLRDSFSYKFKFDSNTVTNTDVDLWLIRGKTANATLPVAADVCFAIKFSGEEDLMIAVYDGATAHTTTIDVSTINSGFTNLAAQQEFMWTWDGTTAKVYGRYRKPVGSSDNDWSIWYTMGSLTPSGMSAGTTNLSFGGLHFLQHTPVTCTSYTKTYVIWDLEHTTHVIAPN